MAALPIYAQQIDLTCTESELGPRLDADCAANRVLFHAHSHIMMGEAKPAQAPGTDIGSAGCGDPSDDSHERHVNAGLASSSSAPRPGQRPPLFPMAVNGCRHSSMLWPMRTGSR